MNTINRQARRWQDALFAQPRFALAEDEIDRNLVKMSRNQIVASHNLTFIMMMIDEVRIVQFFVTTNGRKYKR